MSDADIVVLDPKRITYQHVRAWKYRTTQKHQTNIGIYPLGVAEIKSRWGEIVSVFSPDGTLFIADGYAWDGPSGPTIDTSDTMRASLYHDVGYQLMRKGLLAIEFKDRFDRLLERILIEDGLELVRLLEKMGGLVNKAKAMWIRNTIKPRAAMWYQAVSKFAGSACKPGPDPIDEEIIAPSV